jgi:hypothetical protein
VLDLRNRLAHFKDSDASVAQKISVHEVDPGKLPDNDLIIQLSRLSAKEYAQIITDIIALISSMKDLRRPAKEGA